MSAQTIVGLLLLLVGVAIKVTAAILKLPEIGLIGEMTNFGFLLLGKELMPASAAMQAKRSSLPPAGGAALIALALFLCGCGGASRLDQALADARAHANDMRDDVNRVAEALNFAGPTIELGCHVLGQTHTLCSTGHALHEGLRQSVDATRKIIDAYDATALGYEHVRETVRALEVSAAGFTHHIGLVTEALHELATVTPVGPAGDGAQPSGPAAENEGAPAP